MRIALYGNVCNNMLAIARAVRDHTDHQADLFLGTESENNNLPENDYPEYRDGYLTGSNDPPIIISNES